MTCSLGRCDGHGYVEVFALHTQQRGESHAWVQKEWLTKEQAQYLEKQGLDHQKQRVYSGVKRCDCKGVTA